MKGALIEPRSITWTEEYARAWMTWLSEAYLSRGPYDDARQLVGRALALARERHQRGVETLCHRLEVEATMRLAPFDADAVERRYHESLALRTELGIGMRPLVACRP